MPKSSKPRFDNILLKQWLLKVGPVRRKVLLMKATERNDRTKGSRSKIKTVHLQRDSINNKNNNHSIIKTERGTIRTSSMSGDLTKELKQREAERRGSSGSHRSKKTNRESRKEKHRALKEGENPNGINWHLTKIDMKNPLMNPGRRFLQLRQSDRKKKKERLHAKFLEIFGEDIDLPKDKSKSKDKAKEIYKEQIPKTSIRCEDKKVDSEGTAEPRSPTFGNHYRKRRRESHQEVKKKQKYITSGAVDTSRTSVSSDNASTEQEGTSPVLEEETNSLGDNIVTVDWTPAVESVLEDRVTLGQCSLAVEETDTDTRSTICVVSETPETDKAAGSRLGNICEREERTEEPLGGLRLSMESDQESCNTIHITPSLVETVPAKRQQSVIFELDRRCIESEEASVVKSYSPQLSEHLDTPKQRTDLTQDVTGRVSSVSDDRTSPIEVTADNVKPQNSNLSEIQASLCPKNLKKESTEQPEPTGSPSAQFDWTFSSIPDQEPLNIGISFSANIPENDPNPTSTTDTEASTEIKSEISCTSDRLLGALDNIYLTLYYRRRVQERIKTASKLAIKRNRQEETLKAQHEFESKLIIFRNEICYLFSRLDTWDRVLRFISQGLDHRTPAGTKQFSAAEVESAMLDAEVKYTLGIGNQESPAVPKPHKSGKVLCTIDLTEDNRIENRAADLCDSSTDPPKSLNHAITGLRSDTEVYSSWTCDFNANEIQRPLPSITEVRTISPQQFETLGDRAELPSPKHPCYLCLRASLVACGRCTWATYCSKDCQEAHWEMSHHATCVPTKMTIPSDTL